MRGKVYSSTPVLEHRDDTEQVTLSARASGFGQ